MTRDHVGFIYGEGKAKLVAELGSGVSVRPLAQPARALVFAVYI